MVMRFMLRCMFGGPRRIRMNLRCAGTRGLWCVRSRLNLLGRAPRLLGYARWFDGRLRLTRRGFRARCLHAGGYLLGRHWTLGRAPGLLGYARWFDGRLRLTRRGFRARCLHAGGYLLGRHWTLGRAPGLLGYARWFDGRLRLTRRGFRARCLHAGGYMLGRHWTLGRVVARHRVLMDHARASGLSCAHDSGTAERAGPRRRGDGRVSLILAGTQRRLAARHRRVLSLFRSRIDVPFTDCGQLRRRGLRMNAVAAVVAHAIDGDVVNDGFVVHIGNVHAADVVDGTVVVKMAAPPVAALVAIAAVSIAVIHAAVKSHLRAPVAGMPEKYRALHSPVPRRPEIIGLRRQHPRSRHPVIVLVVIAPSPVSRGPEIAIFGDLGLVVDRKFG